MAQLAESSLGTTRITASGDAVPKEVTDWFRSAAIPLHGTDPQGTLEDMLPLRAVIGDASIVSMGEATHGTHEFFQLKHRMLKFLAEKMGFTAFAIEANWPESLAVNDYVLNGNGDPAEALAGMYFWTWNTEEVLDMILWMRRYNEDKAHSEKLRFFGFDMQAARVAVENSESYLRDVDPNEAKLADEILNPLSTSKGEREYPHLPRDLRTKTSSGIAELLKTFDERKNDYIKRSSLEEWSLAQHNLEIVSQAEQLYSAGRSGSMLRDRLMAANIEWILDHEPHGTKLMIWAHNGHVWSNPGSMGNFLRQTYGREMVVCGFSFNEGSFQARELTSAYVRRGRLREFTVGPAMANSLDSALAGTGLSLFAIDLRSAPVHGVVSDWLSSQQSMRSIGAAYNETSPQNFYVRIPPRSFDVIFFVNQTTSAHENPARTDAETQGGS